MEPICCPNPIHGSFIGSINCTIRCNQTFILNLTDNQCVCPKFTIYYPSYDKCYSDLSTTKQSEKLLICPPGLDGMQQWVLIVHIIIVVKNLHILLNVKVINTASLTQIINANRIVNVRIKKYSNRII